MFLGIEPRVEIYLKILHYHYARSNSYHQYPSVVVFNYSTDPHPAFWKIGGREAMTYVEFVTNEGNVLGLCRPCSEEPAPRQNCISVLVDNKRNSRKIKN